MSLVFVGVVAVLDVSLCFVGSCFLLRAAGGPCCVMSVWRESVWEPLACPLSGCILVGGREPREDVVGWRLCRMSGVGMCFGTIGRVDGVTVGW